MWKGNSLKENNTDEEKVVVRVQQQHCNLIKQEHKKNSLYIMNTCHVVFHWYYLFLFYVLQQYC